MLVGNKVDCEDQRVVSVEQGQKLADEHGILFEETSAAKSVKVRESFEVLLRKVYEMKSELGIQEGSKLRKSKGAAGSCC